MVVCRDVRRNSLLITYWERNSMTKDNNAGKRTHLYIILPIVITLLLVGSAFAVWKCNRFYIELDMPESIQLEYGEESLPAFEATYRGTLIHRQGTRLSVEVEGEVDFSHIGTYDIHVSAEFRGLVVSEKRTVAIVDTVCPIITLQGNPNQITNPGLGYEEEGFVAVDNYDGDLTHMVSIDEKEGNRIYTVTDSSGNRTSVERIIQYKDEIAPVLTLTNQNSISINKGETFREPGFAAMDETDGELTQSVWMEGSVDTNTYGTYQLIYRVKDAAGNTAEAVRNIRVGDFKAPSLYLKGETSLYIKAGTAYIEPGYTANDNVDGEITKRVSVSGRVDTEKMGINTLTYTVTDQYGNRATAERTVYVYQKQAEPNPVNPGNKVVYLTFDDGPGKYTEKLLNILDKYGVKATFFVTNQFPAYQHMIGEEYRRGHTIALHTYSHTYSQVYASETAYYEDLNKIKDICVAQTGIAPTIVRFPGGTSNTVSRKYNPGIMTRLTKSISYFGYQYCDWNVTGGDSGATSTTDSVYTRVTNGIKKHSVSIVLQHDVQLHSVNAVERILFWGIQNGYTFLPMSDTTPMVQQKPQN